MELYFRTWWAWIPVGIFFPRAWDVPGLIPFPGGWLIGFAMMANLLAAHSVRFRWTRDRIGIVLIHVSLILLLAGEFVTGVFAVESRMSIDEGQTVNYAEDTRSVELAIVDVTDPDRNRIVAIPQRLLAREKEIELEGLPFDVRVDRFFTNANIVDSGQAPARAVHGNRGAAAEDGLAAVEKAPAAGVGDDEMDLPVAQVTLLDGGQELGTWLTSLYFSLVPSQGYQTVDVNGRRYELWLRYVRDYKPYEVTLIDFKHDRYLGTNTPRNYSSLVRVVDAEKNLDHEVLIWMNHPLRHRGETFYQASFKQGDMGTVLQIVKNPGWLLPYVACTIGALGLGWHFGQTLMRFLRRQSKRPASESGGGKRGRGQVPAAATSNPGRAG
jgi:hypothetical protein